MPRRAPSVPMGKLAIFVIGDVHVDWLFQSCQPAPSRILTWRPWSRSSAAKMHCVPAGAWLAGHMLYGALTTPPEFERQHQMKVDVSDAHEIIDIKLRGEPVIDAESFTVLIEPNPDYVVRQGDTVIGKLNKQLEIKITKRGNMSTVVLEAGLSNIEFNFEGEETLSPGFLEVSQLNRCYNLENVSFSQTAFSLSNLLVEDAAIEIRHKSSRNADKDVQRCHSLAIFPNAATPDAPTSPEQRIKVKVKNNASLKFKKAKLWVNFGELTAQTISIDRGKIPTIGNRSANVELRQLKSARFDFYIYNYPDNSLLFPDSECMQLTLSELNRFNRYSGQSSSLQVFRRSKSHGASGPNTGMPNVLNRYRHQKTLTESGSANTHEILAHAPAKLIFIDDEGLGFLDNEHLWLQFSQTTDQSSFYVIKSSQQTMLERGFQKFFNTSKNSMRTVLVVSAESVRDGLFVQNRDSGSKLSMTLSWEQTVDDLVTIVASIQTVFSPKLLVIRFGLEGAVAVHFNTNVDGNAEITQLDFCCDPTRVEGEYAPTHRYGAFPGQTTVLACSITSAVAHELERDFSLVNATETSNRVATAAASAIKHGLQAARRYFDMGYGTDDKSIERFSNLQLPTTQVFRTGRVQHLSQDGMHRFCSSTFNQVELEQTWPCIKPMASASDADMPAVTHWSFLDRFLDRPVLEEKDAAFPTTIENFDKVAKAAFRRGVNALTLARQIVRQGFEKTMSRLGNPFPYGKFGNMNMIAVERHEIEAIRSLKNVLAEHVYRNTAEKPISVAVFGPPGSGKSFAVRQVASMVADDLIREFTFNLAQFTKFQEITKLLLEVRDARLKKKIPLVFFDEFDCALDKEKLGWLKYFLAPMQDGAFQHGDSILGTGKAIFVFAGGIAPTREKFRDSSFWMVNGNATENRFKDAKGPDFESRLRGHLDVEGINPSFDFPLESTDYELALKSERFTFVLRRAILARFYIEQIAKETANALLDIDGNAEIDTDVINALLLTGNYVHGARSLEAFFDTCHLLGEHALSKTMIAPPECLDGHLDSGFFQILNRKLREDSLLSTIINYRRLLPSAGRVQARIR